MNFDNIIEIIEFELLLEGLGTIFAFSILWHIFFHNGIPSLLMLFVTTIC